MTIREWLNTRTPAAPTALAARMQSALGAQLDRDSSHTVDVCIEAGISLARTLITDGSTSRETALDLLVADALLTYAFEAAAEQSLDIDVSAESAMTRISAIAIEGPG